jgi:hypothetical protein
MQRKALHRLGLERVWLDYWCAAGLISRAVLLASWCLMLACRDYYVHAMAMTLTMNDAGNAGWASALPTELAG